MPTYRKQILRSSGPTSDRSSNPPSILFHDAIVRNIPDTAICGLNFGQGSSVLTKDEGESCCTVFRLRSAGGMAPFKGSGPVTGVIPQAAIS